MKLAILFFSTLLAAACGGDDAETASGTHAARCEVSCASPAEGGCAGGDEAMCVDGCVAQTEGLSDGCAQCMIEESFWDACTCSCYGEGCCLQCGEGPWSGCLPSDSCDSSMETCRGFELGSSSEMCASQCAVIGQDAGVSR